jgi:hypothetical protein
MIPRPLLAATVHACLCATAAADPLHANANGDYWHHDSHWIFPDRIGEFIRVGVPQDVAGSRDAVAHYALVVRGQRVVVAVDVFPQDSAAEGVTLESARAALRTTSSAASVELQETEMPLAQSRLRATRIAARAPGRDAAAQVLYFVSIGEWRVRVVADIPAGAAGLRDELDQFVRAQRWDTLLQL